MTGVRRHRAPRGPVAERLAGIGTRCGAASMVIAAIAAGGAIKGLTPDTDTRERPFARGGISGDVVNLRRFEVTVLGVRGAARLYRSGDVRETSGVWILVKMRVVAVREPATVSYAAVRDGQGRTYAATERVKQPNTPVCRPAMM